MVFGSTTLGQSDRWNCPDPCPYTYPNAQ
jgi:hypothetical protein